ncbi:MAG: STAS domain-containing protein [Pseudanabaenaceae cyanobacterium]
MSQVEVIAPVGRLDISNAGQLRRQVSEIAEKKPNVLLVDLKEVSFMDSSGLGSLVSALKTMRGIGADMVLCSPNEQVNMLFELTSMSRIFKIYRSREEFKAKTGIDL